LIGEGSGEVEEVGLLPKKKVGVVAGVSPWCIDRGDFMAKSIEKADLKKCEKECERERVWKRMTHVNCECLLSFNSRKGISTQQVATGCSSTRSVWQLAAGLKIAGRSMDALVSVDFLIKCSAPKN